MSRTLFGRLKCILAGKHQHVARDDLRCAHSRPKTCFPLAAYREHEHEVEFDNVGIQSDVTVSITANDELSLAIGGRATNQRAVFENVDCLDDLPDANSGSRDFMYLQVCDDPLEIICDRGREFDTRHASTPGFTRR